MMVQHMQIDEHNTTHKQYQGQKSFQIKMILRIHLTPVRVSITKTTTNASEDAV
jgi:hypothetical protein